MRQGHPFVWEHYRRILTASLDAGYKFVGFDDVTTNKRIYLRHDIDNDIFAAHQMAAFEYDLGVKSTYLVLLRSANYNTAEKRSLHLLEEMADMGHEIGLHFSLVDHPAHGKDFDLAKLILHDVHILSLLIDKKVNVFGFHNPTESDNYRIKIPNLINTYDSLFFTDAYYTSESNMRWAKGCPCEVLSHTEHLSVQLLVHPLSFAAELASDRDVLLHFLKIKLVELLDYNVTQNRVLKDVGITMKEVLQFLGMSNGIK